MQIDANAVIEAYQERLKILTHELMLAQAYIAAQSQTIKELEPKTGENPELEKQGAQDNTETRRTDRLQLRVTRGLYVARESTGGLATTMEAILRGEYDDWDEHSFLESIRSWRAYEASLYETPEHTTETRNGTPVTVLAEGVREEDMALRVTGIKTEAALRDARVGRVPGEPR